MSRDGTIGGGRQGTRPLVSRPTQCRRLYTGRVSSQFMRFSSVKAVNGSPRWAALARNYGVCSRNVTHGQNDRDTCLPRAKSHAAVFNGSYGIPRRIPTSQGVAPALWIVVIAQVERRLVRGFRRKGAKI